jgi:hypothetical protein
MRPSNKRRYFIMCLCEMVPISMDYIESELCVLVISWYHIIVRCWHQYYSLHLFLCFFFFFLFYQMHKNFKIESFYFFNQHLTCSYCLLLNHFPVSVSLGWRLVTPTTQYDLPLLLIYHKYRYWLRSMAQITQWPFNIETIIFFLFVKRISYLRKS